MSSQAKEQQRNLVKTNSEKIDQDQEQRRQDQRRPQRRKVVDLTQKQMTSIKFN